MTTPPFTYVLSCVLSSCIQQIETLIISLAAASFPLPLSTCIVRSCRTSSLSRPSAFLTAHLPRQRDLRTGDRISAGEQDPPAPIRIYHNGKGALRQVWAFRIPYRIFPGSRFRRNRSSPLRDGAFRIPHRIFRCSPRRSCRSSFRRTERLRTRRMPEHSPSELPGHFRSAHSACRPSDRAAPH